MNDSSFGMVQRFPEGDLRELFSPIACLCNVSTLFLIFGLYRRRNLRLFSWMEDPMFSFVNKVDFTCRGAIAFR